MSEDVDYPTGCQPIINSINVSQQIERLRKLADCLYDCKPNSSEEVRNPQRFQRLFYHLAQDAFLENANIDFRIYLSLCLANILRVYHPEIPTATADDLKEVYIFIFRTLRGLGDVTTDSPKYKNYYHLVEAIEKILQPITEMSTQDDQVMAVVLRALVKNILGAACGKGWRKSVESETDKIRRSQVREADADNDDAEDEEDENPIFKVRSALVNIATMALSDTERVPNEVLDVLFHHIIEPQRTNFKDAGSLAQDIIAQCLESETPLALSIRETMDMAVKEAKLPDEFEMTGSHSRQKYFELLRFLHNISPDLVCTAVAELNFWLQSENEKYRREAVTIVGLITRQNNCRLGMDSNDVTWSAFLNAARDRDEGVRLEFVEQSKHVLISIHSHLRGHVINCLIQLCTDPSEKIRTTVVTAVTEVAKSKLEVISDKLLRMCAHRMKDKKSEVRIHAIKRLMDLYHNVMTGHPRNFYGTRNESESALTYTKSDKECVRFIPTAVFLVYRITLSASAYTDARLTIERYIHLYFIPYNLDAKKRVQLMFEMFRGLDDVGTMMFGEYITRSSQLRRAMIGILCQVSQAAKQSTEGQLKNSIKRLVHIFPDAALLEKLLINFVNMMAEDERVFNGVKQLVADNYTTSEINSASSYVLAACSKNKMFNKSRKEKEKMETNPNEPDVTVTFRYFITRITPLSFDVPAAEEIIRVVSDTVTGKVQLKRAAEANFERDLTLLKIFTEHFAHLFVGDEIVEEIRSNMLNTEEPKVVEAALNALNKIVCNSVFRQKLASDATRKERWFLAMSKDLKELVLRTESPYRRSCKLATRLLASLLGKEKSVEYFDTIVDELLDRLELQTEGAANAFQVLAEIFRTHPIHFFPKIMDVVESGRIGSIITSTDVDDEDPIEFNDSVHMERQPWPRLAMTKVYAVKFITKVLLTLPLAQFGSKPKGQMVGASQKLIDLLGDILEKRGDLSVRQCEVEKARLRAAAGASLLKLASVMQYRSKIDTSLFKNMAWLINDEAHCVRLYYGVHVRKELGRRLPIEFAACYGIVNLGLTEDEGENKLEGFRATCIKQMQEVFADRSEDKANAQNLEGAKRAMFCAENMVAYVIWLLTNYDKLERVEDNATKSDTEEELKSKCANVNMLSEMQESLWMVMDVLINSRCNMQKVWKVLEKMKTCGDKPMRNFFDSRLGELREHNKKLWALTDLAITMMLYRAKLQMEDEDRKEDGYNLQFFYICRIEDNADPSNVFAPDILIADEQLRNGKSPRLGRLFHVGDLTAEFTPPPQTNETANLSKNVSKRGKAPSTSAANTSKRRGGKKAAPKRRSGGRAEESDEEEEEEEVEKATKSPKKPRGKRSVYEIPESEDDEIEEIMPLPKRRGAPAATSTPSASNGTRNGTLTSPKKQTSGRGKNRRKAPEDDEEEEVEIEDDSEEEKKDGDDEEEEREEDLSLDKIVLSPIVDESSGRTRRSTRNAVLTSSTPLVVTKPTKGKRKIEETEEEEEDVAENGPSPKKRASGKRAPPAPAKKKAPVVKSSPKKKPVTSPKKNKFGLPLEEDNEEESPPPPLRTRQSARLSRK